MCLARVGVVLWRIDFVNLMCEDFPHHHGKIPTKCHDRTDVLIIIIDDISMVLLALACHHVVDY